MNDTSMTNLSLVNHGQTMVDDCFNQIGVIFWTDMMIFAKERSVRCVPNDRIR